MNSNTYQNQVSRTARAAAHVGLSPAQFDMLCATMDMYVQVCEMVDRLKKHLFHEHEFQGDVFNKTAEKAALSIDKVALIAKRLQMDSGGNKPFELNPQQASLLNWALGIGGEAGEVINLVDTHVWKRADNKEEIKLEEGDLLWYVAQLATSLGFELDEVMRSNLDKLADRYPRGFNPRASMNRIR